MNICKKAAAVIGLAGLAMIAGTGCAETHYAVGPVDTGYGPIPNRPTDLSYSQDYISLSNGKAVPWGNFFLD
jgi:hypothetical protein